ncbi:MAG: biopolymer transporter ExbD [Deltaproteobacteria bacterium]|nr:biopolymer transporter ExbD [Deltaproteobacteria bacterium]
MKNEINVTPLVDVVLVLLIIFMVVTPMLSRGVAVDLPETKHHEKRNDTGSQVVVSIAKDGRIYVDADPVTEDEIGARLRRELDQKAKGGERLIHVKGDRRLTYGEVRKVLERIHEAGAAQVALGTEELKKTEGTN